MLCLAASLPLLVSCGGGGGGGGGGTGNLKNHPSAAYLASVAEPSGSAPASAWSASQEYVNSTGLAQLKAAEGYARRSGGSPGGQGVRIAIIDSGIDVSHPDLGNLLGVSWTAGGEALQADNHATFVAGIAGARRTQSGNSNDMHGMAYRATLVNFQTSRPSVTQSSGDVTFSNVDLVDALRAASGLEGSALAVESDILNLSLGAYAASDSAFASLRTAMRAAASEGKIMVLAAGNEGADSQRRQQPIYPAAYADDAGIAGHAIVVGNLTSTDQAAPSSNFCGDTKSYCLFAPGSNIRSTLSDGGYGVGSGTSFATPYVSGAAAVVKAAFPGVSSRDVVDRLLLTAEDLGDPGVDDIFGRGRLDLEAAMAPVGPTGFPIGPTVDGRRLAVAPSALRLGQGLALDEAESTALRTVMAVDDMGFPFPVDLANGIEETPRENGLRGFVAGDGGAMTMSGLPEARIFAHVSERELDLADDGFPAATDGYRSERRRAVPLRFEGELTESATLFASLHGDGEARLGLEDGLADRGASLLQTDGFFAPYGGWAGNAADVGIGLRAEDGTALALSARHSIGDQGSPSASMQRLEFETAVPGEIELRFGLGLVQEEGGFMGGRSGGAFGDDVSARSHFLTLAALGPITEAVDWFGVYSHGRTSIAGGDGGLIRDWSDVGSEAFGLGVVIRGALSEGDGLSLMVGQPLRQARAEASITLPVARRPDGSVVTAEERIDVAPKGREIATELGYRLPLGEADDQDIRAAAFVRLNPDHDPDRDPEAGVGFAYRWRF